MMRDDAGNAGMTRVVLASGSPRRRELLLQVGIEFDVISYDIDESVHDGEDPTRYVRRLAEEKHLAARQAGAIGADRLVIAADTTVDLDGHILGKPVDADDARAMLRALASRTHRVHTGLHLSVDGRSASEVVTTSVTFTPISDAQLDWYIGTGEAFDKAGAYGMQGAAGVFVASIEGSVSNVIGLPLATMVSLAASLGVDLFG